METKSPQIPKEVLIWLLTRFPNKVPQNPDKGVQDWYIKIGQQQVITAVLNEYLEQNHQEHDIQHVFHTTPEGTGDGADS